MEILGQSPGVLGHIPAQENLTPSILSLTLGESKAILKDLQEPARRCKWDWEAIVREVGSGGPLCFPADGGMTPRIKRSPN